MQIRILLLTIVAVSLALGSCASTPTGVVLLAYDQPQFGSGGAVGEPDFGLTDEETSFAHDTATRLLRDDPKGLAGLQMTGIPGLQSGGGEGGGYPGSGADNPRVAPGDFCHLLLRETWISDHGDWFSGELAVLFRVRQSTNPDDDPWILAWAQDGVQEDAKLDCQNLVIWSGQATKSLVIEVKLIGLDALDKALRTQALSVASSIAGFIPVYGQIAQALLSVGQLINAQTKDSRPLMQFAAGFTPGDSLRYGVYGVVPQKVLRKQGEMLWYSRYSKDPAIRVEEKILETNWITFEIAKGASRTFEIAKAKTVQELVDKVNSDQLQRGNIDVSGITEKVSSLLSYARMEQIHDSIDFASAESIRDALRAIKMDAATPKQQGGGLLDASTLAVFSKMAGVFLPEEVRKEFAELNTPVGLEKAMSALDALDAKYRFDDKRREWVKRS